MPPVTDSQTEELPVKGMLLFTGAHRDRHDVMDWRRWVVPVTLKTANDGLEVVACHKLESSLKLVCPLTMTLSLSVTKSTHSSLSVC